MASEAKKRAEAEQQMRATYPAPTSCQMAYNNMPKIRQHMAAHQAEIDSGASPNVAPRYVEALTKILGEYSDYITNSCSLSAVTDPVLAGAVVPNGVPGSTATPGILPGEPAPGTKPPVATPSSGAAAGAGAAPPAPAAKKEIIKGIPNWAFWTGIVLVGITGIVIVVKVSK
jgi:hypothetical protein